MHLMTLPALTNATLTQVATAGFQADGDLPATVGTAKWTGAQDVFWSEVINEVTQDQLLPGRVRRFHGTEDIFTRRYLIVDANVDIPWAIDDVVTVISQGDTFNGVVQVITTSRAPSFGVTRLELTDA